MNELLRLGAARKRSERRRHRWINALIVIAPVAFALVYALIIATPRYEAESRFFVQSGSGQQGGGAPDQGCCALTRPKPRNTV